jgi:hypothetical protein
MKMYRRLAIRASLLVFSMLLANVTRAVAAPCASGAAPVNQWQCWQQTITAGGLGLGANPYRDYIIQVTLVHSTLGTSTQDVFWENDLLHPNNFTFRIAFPAASPTAAATVTWSNVTCRQANPGGPSCPTNLSWTPSSGAVTINPASTGKNIYDKGFLRQYTFYGYSPLFYWDLSQQFYWNGDTAWSAPGFEASGQTSNWGSASQQGSYIADRQSKGFNVVLVAPAATYQAVPLGKPGPLNPPQPPPPGGNCTARVPNDCSTPNQTYWANFDGLISTANQADIIPLIAGLAHPVDDYTGPTRYPCQKNAVAFSRYLAARMAGFAVMLSPGFDDQTTATTSCSGETLSGVMNAIGSAVKTGSTPPAATPRVVLTNHIAGKSTCSDYQAFRDSIWMSFFLFQSGHGAMGASDDSSICPALYSNESQLAQPKVPSALRRSWQMPWTLTDSSAQPPLPSYSPALPSYNGEGPYDDICLQTSGCASYDPNAANNNYAKYVDLRYHERQAAYESLFSDAYGFTYGGNEIAHWNFVGQITFAQALAGFASGDMQNIFINFKTRAGLTAYRNWIVNNGPDTASDGNFKKALASDGSSLVLAYMPAMSSVDPNPTIQISTSSLPGLSCSGNGWTARWFHAQDNAAAQALPSCSGTSTLTVPAPLSSECQNSLKYELAACDWVLQIQKTGSASIASQASIPGQSLDVWADMSPGDGTSAIYAQLAGPPGSAPAAAPVLISPPGIAFQQSPRVTRVRNGYLVVWHADGLDGSMLGVFAQRLDQHGQPIGSRIQINTTTEEDQRDPVVDSSPSGNSVVVWTSHGQDGDLGGIYGRLLDPSGTPLTGELRINTMTAGHQEAPQVAYLPGGGFVVAWHTRAMDENPGALSFKIFSGTGSAATPEIRIPGQAGVAHRLIDVMPTATGGLQLRWRLIGPDGGSRALLRQEFDAAGQSVGPASSLQ